MKIEVDEKYNHVLKEVYNELILETAEGNRMYVCMRDDTFELHVEPKGKVGTSYRVNMQNCKINKK